MSACTQRFYRGVGVARRRCYHSPMQPVATVVAFAAAPAGAAATLDTTALACDLLGPGEDLFRRIKRTEAGSMLLLLAGSADEAALAAGSKAPRILRQRGGGQAPVVLPALAGHPRPPAPRKKLRAGGGCVACVGSPPRRRLRGGGGARFV